MIGITWGGSEEASDFFLKRHDGIIYLSILEWYLSIDRSGYNDTA
jgi:hypothetical protein